MLKIGIYICEELKDSKVVLRKLDVDKRNKIVDVVLKKYMDSNKKGRWLWEKLIHYEVLNNDMAWSYIKDYVKNNECIMFFNQDDEKEMFLIKSGEDLNYILSETFGFEFYITDKQCSYLLCYSHHDILYGCGGAEEWIRCLKLANGI